MTKAFPPKTFTLNDLSIIKTFKVTVLLLVLKPQKISKINFDILINNIFAHKICTFRFNKTKLTNFQFK